MASFLILQPVHACQEVNFYETHPAINDLPIINQGSLNACYAHILSTVYNLDVAKNTEDQLHPFWVAFVHKNQGLHWQPKKLDYSLLSLAWNDLRKHGTCPHSLVQNRITELKNGAPYSDSQFFYLLDHYFKTKKNLTKTDLGYHLVLLKLHRKLIKESGGKFEIPWKLEHLYTVLNPIRHQVARQSFFEWMKSSVFKNCSDNASYKPNQTLASTGRSTEKNTELSSIIESLLAKNQSVSVGYCLRMIKDPTFLKDIQPRVLKLAYLKCGAHYSTLVGSRKVGNSCEYLLRNSYGKSFWAHESYTCYCKNTSTGENRDCQKSEINDPNLEVLGCWVNSDKLLTNTFDISYFKN